jgi:hypothetical protein
MAFGYDLTEREQVKAPVDAVVAEQGKLDVIVNKPRDHARAANSLNLCIELKADDHRFKQPPSVAHKSAGSASAR